MKYFFIVVIAVLCTYFLACANECDTDQCLVQQCVDAGESIDVCNDF